MKVNQAYKQLKSYLRPWLLTFSIQMYNLHIQMIYFYLGFFLILIIVIAVITITVFMTLVIRPLPAAICSPVQSPTGAWYSFNLTNEERQSKKKYIYIYISTERHTLVIIWHCLAKISTYKFSLLISIQFPEELVENLERSKPFHPDDHFVNSQDYLPV